MQGLVQAALLAGLAGQAGAPQEGASPPPDDARVRAAWATLSAAERKEALEWLGSELEAARSYLQQCREHALELSDRDASFWPDAAERPFFDPAVHAPAQPIPRRRLPPSSAEARGLLARIAETRPPRELRSAWTYDWASGELRRGADSEDAADGERVFENALAGVPPEADLAEALVLRALDTGEQRLVLDAFEHAYTDRAGNVYPCSLYQAWSSGVEIEMPDVDTVAIARTALKKKQWVAPVPASKQRPLYDAIGKAFADARRYRGLREALAASYLRAEPVLWDGYKESLVRFQALWDKHSARPASLAPALPRDAEQWTDFLAEWADACGRDPKLYESGKARQQALATDAAAVRASLVWVLEELGAFEREGRPAQGEEKEGEEGR